MSLGGAGKIDDQGGTHVSDNEDIEDTAIGQSNESLGARHGVKAATDSGAPTVDVGLSR